VCAAARWKRRPTGATARLVGRAYVAHASDLIVATEHWIAIDDATTTAVQNSRPIGARGEDQIEQYLRVT